jgi:hypothetical protein
MPRPRLLIATALSGLLLVAPLGAAVAEDDGTGTPPSTSAAENTPPVAAPDEASVDAGHAVRIPVLANDTDDGLGRPEGEPPRLDVVGVTGGDGRATFTATDVTFTARLSDSGTYVVSYDVTDGTDVSTGQVSVRVTAAPPRSVSIRMASRPVALKRYAISGEVQPVAAGRAVVKVQRRTPDGWVLHAKDSTGAAGGYAVTFRTSKTGKRVFRAVAVWPNGRKVVSDTITRTVRAVADAQISGPLTASQVPYSWRPGCPVPPSMLRKIHINRFNYKKRIARGTIVVRAVQAGDIVKVLTAALAERFPIRSLKPTDRYYDGGRRTPMESDKASMRAGNTSAFNCRPVVGNPYRVSQHSYGNAVDINTIENPYVTGSKVYPEGSREYLDRSPYRRGMILKGGVVASRMRNLGWLWGARWSHPDYQHFSSNGG